jgi:antitoxin FitA
MADTFSFDYKEIVDINLWGVPVSSITIRNLDDGLKTSLRIRAARHGLSMEQEVRNILQNTLTADANPTRGLAFAQCINQRFKGLGGDDLSLPERTPACPVPDLS